MKTESMTYKTKLGTRIYDPGSTTYIIRQGERKQGMIIYRPVRGSFRRAMEEARVFETEDDMKDFICSELYSYDGTAAVSKEDIVIKDDPISDPRNGWEDTNYVCTKRFGHEVYETPQCIGFCATKFPDRW